MHYSIFGAYGENGTELKQTTVAVFVYSWTSLMPFFEEEHCVAAALNVVVEFYT